MPVTRQAHILIIDADESVRHTFHQFLSREGYGPVLTASTAAEALQAVRNGTPFDLVICDIMLEEGKGPELLRHLREAGVDCPVIMITGAPDIVSAAEMVRLGAFDYIAKPITKQLLLRLVGQGLRHRALQKEKNNLLTENEKYRRHLEAVFRSVQDAIISADRDLNILRCNERASALIAAFGGNPSAQPRKLADIPGDFGSACLQDGVQVMRDQTEIKDHLIEWTDAAGRTRLISLNAAPILENNAVLNGVVIVARDISATGAVRRRDFHGVFHGFVDNSPAMIEIYNLIENVGKVDTTVLITGESGTGKEITAEALHAESPRRDAPLVKVDCASIPEELLESELFGHLKGAFTGADRNRGGRIMQADGGTLFLDEIGDISSRLQLRLLRFLQERTFYPVGGDKPVMVDVRVITATNADLQNKVKQGLFREDLFYRIRVVEINLPPLRARREGIPLLVNHFLTLFAAKLDRNITGISDQAMQALVSYFWPGNVRELQHSIERACVLCEGPTLSLECLPREIRAPIAGPASASGITDADSLPAGPGQTEAFSPMLPQPAATNGSGLPMNSDDAGQIEAIKQALQQAKGNKSKAAQILGVDRSTLYRRMRRLNLS